MKNTRRDLPRPSLARQVKSGMTGQWIGDQCQGRMAGTARPTLRDMDVQWLRVGMTSQGGG